MLDRAQAVFSSLSEHDVKYVVIGGVAAIIHGVGRTTLDLDILIEATPENAQRLLDALIAANLQVANHISAEALLEKEVVIFKDRIRVDVQTSTPGIEFQSAWERRETREYDGQKFYILSMSDLIASKLAAGRPQDLEDVKALEAIRQRRPDRR